MDKLSGTANCTMLSASASYFQVTDDTFGSTTASEVFAMESVEVLLDSISPIQLHNVKGNKRDKQIIRREYFPFISLELIKSIIYNTKKLNRKRHFPSNSMLLLYRTYMYFGTI